MGLTSKASLGIAFLLLTVSLFARTYSTSFPATENPICEGSPCNWKVPGSVAPQWANVQSLSGYATGVGNQPTTYGDPTAILTGTFGPDQAVQATVYVNQAHLPASGEVELRLRTTITTNSITGYEVLCPTQNNPGYGIQVVRWNGPNGRYAYLTMTGNTGAHQCVNGDVIKATVTGTNPVTIKVYLNGASTPYLTGVDHGTESNPGGAAGPWTSGNPGIGFFDGTDTNWSYFGLTNFMATDGSVAPPTGLNATVQ